MASAWLKLPPHEGGNRMAVIAMMMLSDITTITRPCEAMGIG